jgi:hypothetical protein
MNNLGFATKLGLNVRKPEEIKNVFGDSDSEEEQEKPQDIVRYQLEQQRLKVEKEMQLKAKEVQQQDPTAYEYDEVKKKENFANFVLADSSLGI